jgi:hypothetical protein
MQAPKKMHSFDFFIPVTSLTQKRLKYALRRSVISVWLLSFNEEFVR